MKNINEITNQSFAVLRTNPLLTTNVKIMVNENVYISTFNNNVNDINYTATLIDPDKTSYENDLALFFKGVQKDLIYNIIRKNDDYIVYKDFSNQYEMQYNYGCETNKNKNYKEQYKFFAPLWLDGDVPDAFVVFKTDARFEYNENGNPLKDILSSAKIVKTFDLTNKSKIGRYIRNYKNNDNFPKFPLIHSFETDTDYYGIDVIEGGFTSKSEDNKNHFKNQHIELENDEFITRGFERNNLAIANLLNLEFLFDDNDNDYKIYNYIGLYVNFNKIGTSKVKNITEYQDFDVVSFALNETKTIIDGKTNSNNFINKNILSNFYPYIKDNNDTYININKSTLTDLIKKPYISLNGTLSAADKNELIAAAADKKTNATFSYFNYDSATGNLSLDGLSHLKINKNKDVSFDNFYKKKYIASLTEENFIKEDRNKQLVIEITNQPKDGDGFWIMPKNELEFVDRPTDKQMVYYKFDKSTTKTNYRAVDTSKILYTAEATIDDTSAATIVNGVYVNGVIKMTPGMYVKREGVYEERLFSSNGTLNDIATAVAKAINDNEYGYKAKALDNKVFVEDITFVGNINSIFALMYSDTDWCKVSATKIGFKEEFDNEGEVIAMEWDNKEFPLSLYEASFSKYLIDGETITDNEQYREGWDFYITTGGGSAANLYKIYTDFGGLFLTNKMYIKDPITGAEIRITSIFWSELERCYILTTESPVTRYLNGAALKLDVLYESDTDFGIMTFYDFKDFDFDLYTKDRILCKEYAILQENELKELVLKSKIIPYINKFEAYNATSTLPETINEVTNETVKFDILKSKSADDYRNETSIKLSYSKENNNLIDVSKSSFNYFVDLNSMYVNNIVQSDKIFNDLIFKLKNEKGSRIERDSRGVRNIVQYDYRDVNVFNDIFNPISLKREDGTYFEDIKLNSEFIGGSNVAYPTTIFNGLKYIYKRKVSDGRDEYYPTSEINGYKFINLFKITNTNGKIINGKRNISENVVSVVKNDKHNSIVILNELYSPYINSLNLAEKHKYTKKELLSDGNNIDENVNLQGYAMLPVLSRETVTISETFDDGSGKATLLIFDKGINLNIYNNQDILGRKPLLAISFRTGVSLNEDDLFKAENNMIYIFKIKDIVDENRMIVENVGYKFVGGGPVMRYFQTYNNSLLTWNYDTLFNPNNEKIDLSDELLYGMTSAHVYLINCGTNFYEKYLNSTINSKSFVNSIKNNKATYYNINEIGELSNVKYILDVDFGAEIDKIDNLTVKPDLDKPSIYKVNSNIIGSVVETNNNLQYKLRKHTYAYKPKFKTNVNFGGTNATFDLIDSNEIKQFTLNDLREKLYSNEDLDNFEYIRYYFDNFNNKKFAPSLYVGGKKLNEFYYHKVNINNPDILKLSKSTDKLPLYPAINEIAIDVRDLNLFSRKYKSDDFHKLHQTSSETVNYKGTFNPIEDKFFFTSSILNVKDNYIISEFSNEYVNSYDDLQKLITVKDFENVKKSLHLTTEGLKTYIDINLAHAFEQYLINYENLTYHLSNYINANESYGDLTSLDDDTRTYIKNNIYNRFFVKNVKIGYVEDPGAIDNVSADDSILFKSFTNFKSYIINDVLRIELTKHREIPYKFNIEINFEA